MAHMGEMSYAVQNILVLKYDGKRWLRKPWNRVEDNIKVDLKIECENVDELFGYGLSSMGKCDLSLLFRKMNRIS